MKVNFYIPLQQFLSLLQKFFILRCDIGDTEHLLVIAHFFQKSLCHTVDDLNIIFQISSESENKSRWIFYVRKIIERLQLAFVNAISQPNDSMGSHPAIRIAHLCDNAVRPLFFSESLPTSAALTPVLIGLSRLMTPPTCLAYANLLLHESSTLGDELSALKPFANTLISMITMAVTGQNHRAVDSELSASQLRTLSPNILNSEDNCREVRHQYFCMVYFI